VYDRALDIPKPYFIYMNRRKYELKLIFIRHGEPDYARDSLTPAGFREAEILADRIKTWNVTDFYCSPQGRAKKTAEPVLKALNRTATEKAWLHEFHLVPVPDPDGGNDACSWDRLPSYMNENPELLDVAKWKDTPLIRETGYAEYYDRTMRELDDLLREYGYVRDGMYYRVLPDAKRDATVVFFCHLGITCALLSHLLNVAPHVLWQGFFLAPASVTIAGTEERDGKTAAFRVQLMGDTSHLREAKEPISEFGTYTELFEG